MRLVEDEKLRNEAEEVRVVFRMDVTAVLERVRKDSISTAFLNAR